jgi:hypothetical protein
VRPKVLYCTFTLVQIGIGSDVEDEPRRAGAGDADHHAVACLPGFLVQHRVSVVWTSVENGCFAGAAGAFRAGRQRPDSGLLGCGEDGLFGRDGEGELALGEVDLERIVQYGFGEWFGDEPLDVQRSLGPVGFQNSATAADLRR